MYKVWGRGQKSIPKTNSSGDSVLTQLWNPLIPRFTNCLFFSVQLLVAQPSMVQRDKLMFYGVLCINIFPKYHNMVFEVDVRVEIIHFQPYGEHFQKVPCM